MKANAEQKTALMWFCILFVLFLLTSCGTFKKTHTKSSSKVSTERTVVASDSTLVSNNETKEVSEINGPIAKESYISLMTADSLTNARINEALRNFRIYDRSGGNSFKASYDTETMQLLLQAFIQQTENKTSEKISDTNTSTNKSEASEKTLEQQLDEYIEKKTIPWWVYAIGIFLLRNHILAAVGFFIPGIRQVKTFSDLFKKTTS